MAVLDAVGGAERCGFGCTALGAVMRGGLGALRLPAFGFADPRFSLASSLLAKKLAVFAKVLMSSMATSKLTCADPRSITSINRRSSSRSSMTTAPLYGCEITTPEL